MKENKYDNDGFFQKYKMCIRDRFNCGLQSCEPEYTWGPGVRDHYLIHYVASGQGIYKVNDVVYLSLIHI